MHPNYLTLLRIVLAVIFPQLMASPLLSMRLMAFGVFLFAALSDLWDGLIARKTNRVTDTGKILDPIADKILNLGAMWIFAKLGAYPFWIIIPIFIREVLVTMIRIRSVAKREVIAAELSGKIKTVLQYVSIGCSYVYVMAFSFNMPAPWLDCLYVLNLTGIAAALGMTLYSGYLFLKEQGRLEKGIEVVATSGYLGFLPFAPGTWGSVAGVLLYLLIPREPVLYAASLLILIALAVWSAGKHQIKCGSKDPREIVADETVGMLMTYLWLPHSLFNVLAGFALFRFFDIVKPLFIRKIESLPGGWGIVLDDILAGVYANLLLRAVLWLAPVKF